MTSYQIRNELRAALGRKNLTQVQLAQQTYRAVTTINGYFRNDPTPIEAATEIAVELNDSIFTQQLANQAFTTIPPMESELYVLNKETIPVIYTVEQRQIDQLKEKACISLSKVKQARKPEDTESIMDYSLKVLDGIFIETRYLISLLDEVGMSLMSAVIKRTPYWKMKKYLRSE